MCSNGMIHVQVSTYKKSRPAIILIIIFRDVPRRPKYGFMMVELVDSAIPRKSITDKLYTLKPYIDFV